MSALLNITARATRAKHRARREPHAMDVAGVGYRYETDHWTADLELPVHSSLEPGSTANRAYPGFWCAPIPPAYIVEPPPPPVRRGFLALMCALAMFCSGCWMGTIAPLEETPAPVTHRDVKPVNPIHWTRTERCRRALEVTAELYLAEPVADPCESYMSADEFDDAMWSTYWHCRFASAENTAALSQRAGYALVEDCAPEILETR